MHIHLAFRLFALPRDFCYVKWSIWEDLNAWLQRHTFVAIAQREKKGDDPERLWVKWTKRQQGRRKEVNARPKTVERYK